MDGSSLVRPVPDLPQLQRGDAQRPPVRAETTDSESVLLPFYLEGLFSSHATERRNRHYGCSYFKKLFLWENDFNSFLHACSLQTDPWMNLLPAPGFFFFG